MLNMDNVMNIVVKTFNKIKSKALKHRQFRTFLKDMSQHYHDLIYYTEVRWLSRGRMLHRFFELREIIAKFMRTQGLPVPELEDEDRLNDLAFLTDICEHLNQLNTHLRMET
ncbi:hypothetical protein ANN_13226 [Periplaneta americana]|uniref:Uncharacterized protein n=1 Tax=Periplaneta americana TaxID=6978 RepID=A0ABQ8TIY3_PERAM|nr:hypothetical protein ANN_13226 [Periplaneta americana]